MNARNWALPLAFLVGVMACVPIAPDYTSCTFAPSGESPPFKKALTGVTRETRSFSYSTIEAQLEVSRLLSVPAGGFVAVGAAGPTKVAWLGRFDPLGQAVWETRLDTGAAKDVATTPDNRVLVLASSGTNTDAAADVVVLVSEAGKPVTVTLPTGLRFDRISPAPGSDFYAADPTALYRMTSDGKVVWSSTIQSGAHAASPVVVDYLTSRSDGSAILEYFADGSVWILAVDPDGTATWPQPIGPYNYFPIEYATPVVDSTGAIQLWAHGSDRDWIVQYAADGTRKTDLWTDVWTWSAEEKCVENSIAGALPTADGGLDVFWKRTSATGVSTAYNEWIGRFDKDNKPVGDFQLPDEYGVTFYRDMVRVQPGCVAWVIGPPPYRLARVATVEGGCSP